MKRSLTAAFLILAIGLLIPTGTPRAKAQDAAATAVATPNDIIDQFMTQVGQNEIDNAVALMDGLKNEAELRESARAGLLRLRTDQGQYHGYEIAAVQKFTSRFQTVDVLAYYDQQPALLRFHFYRPDVQNNGKWAILGFQVDTDMQEVVTILKDAALVDVGRKP
jgi:hypothetical protein